MLCTYKIYYVVMTNGWALIAKGYVLSCLA